MRALTACRPTLNLASIRRAALLGVLMALWPLAADAETWRKMPTTGLGPGERSSPAVASLGAQVFLFGGVRDDFSAPADVFLDDLYRFDTRSGHWEPVITSGDRPPARAFAGAVANRRRGLMVVFGGASYGPFFSDFVGHDDLWVFDPGASGWRRLAPRNRGPIGRSSPRLWIDGDLLYVFGGISSAFETLNDLWRYDFRSNRWKLLSENGAAGAPPSRHESVGPQQPLSDRLLLYGGEHFDPATGFSTLNDVWEYDLSCGRWSAIPTDPTISPPRTDAAAGEIAGRLYLQGGDLPGGSEGCGAPFPQNPTDQLWRYDGADQRWQQVAPQGEPLPRLKRHKAARVNNRLYLFAGWNFQCPGPGQIWNLEVFVLAP